MGTGLEMERPPPPDLRLLLLVLLVRFERDRAEGPRDEDCCTDVSLVGCVLVEVVEIDSFSTSFGRLLTASPARTARGSSGRGPPPPSRGGTRSGRAGSMWYAGIAAAA